jgi:hypothetical protein
MNTIKLYRIISGNKNISKPFFNLLLADPLLNNSIKKRIIMYVKKDKRLSIPKFMNDLKNIQKGGVGDSCKNNKEATQFVFKFGVQPGDLNTINQVNEVVFDLCLAKITSLNPQNSSKRVSFFTSGPSGPSSSSSGQSIKPDTPNSKKVPPRITSRFAIASTKNIQNPIIKGQIIGSGTYADVYEYKDNQTIKIFKHTINESDLRNINSCIQEFYRHCCDKIKNTSFIDKSINSSYNDIINANIHLSSVKPAYYITKFMNGGSLKDYLNTIINEHDFDTKLNNICNDVHSKLVNDNFIHGDIKIENILCNIDEKKDITTFIHDFDTVYVYNPDTLLHVSITPIKKNACIITPIQQNDNNYLNSQDINFVESYKRTFAITLLSTHPFFPMFKHCICQENINTKEAFITKLTDSIILNDHLKRWKYMVAFLCSKNDNNSYILNTTMLEIIDILNECYIDYGGYEQYIIDVLSNKDSMEDWIKLQMANFDLYSFGASLYIYGIVNNNIKIKEKGKEIILEASDACKIKKGGGFLNLFRKKPVKKETTFYIIKDDEIIPQDFNTSSFENQQIINKDTIDKALNTPFFI